MPQSPPGAMPTRPNRSQAWHGCSPWVARAVFFHRQGEIRDSTFENRSFHASGLSLITAAIVHWNTVYDAGRSFAGRHASGRTARCASRRWCGVRCWCGNLMAPFASGSAPIQVSAICGRLYSFRLSKKARLARERCAEPSKGEGPPYSTSPPSRCGNTVTRCERIATMGVTTSYET